MGIGANRNTSNEYSKAEQDWNNIEGRDCMIPLFFCEEDDDCDDQCMEHYLISMMRMQHIHMLSRIMREPSRELLIDGGDKIEVLMKPDNGEYRFRSRLDYSKRSRRFIHGANMFPGMLSGFNNFISTQQKSLASVKKMKFNHPTFGDLVYDIYSTPQKTLSKKAHVTGEFETADGGIYYFYASEVPFDHEPLVRYSAIDDYLLRGKAADMDSMIQVKDCGNHIKIPLIDLSDFEKEHGTIEAMDKNKGYLWAAILDMANQIMQIKLSRSGVVMSYENLTMIDNIDVGSICSGDHSMHISPLAHKDMHGEEFCKESFELRHGDTVLAKGIINFLFRS